MSGFFTVGERKDRPGIYKRRVNIETVEETGARDGIGAVAVTGDWGPLNTANVVSVSDDIGKYLGSSTGSGFKTVEEIFRGGVQTAVIVRVGVGGTKAAVTLTDTNDTAVDVVTVTAKYPGTMPLSISVKANLIDSSLKDVTIYTGTKVLESRTIAAGNAEVDGIVSAFADSAYVDVAKIAAGNGTLKAAAQASLTGGANPTVTNTSYSDGFETANTELFDTICVDTNDTDVHALLAAFVERIFQAGDYPIAVISEPHTVAIDTRISHAKVFDNEKIVYVLNGWTEADGTSIEGYLAAARLAGMVAAVASDESLTHTAIDGAVSLIDALTNTKIVTALQNGCLVISRSKTGAVMIERAINTLTTLTAEMDAGWKKIRRTKTRFEMMYRIETALEPFVGAVDNDDDGRAAIIAAGQGVLDAMAGEGKILPGASFTLDEKNPPESDSAWFLIRADDVDSFETGYLTFQFRFVPETETE